MWSVTHWLVAINIAVFLIDDPLKRLTGSRISLTDLGYFSTDDAIIHLQLWRFITFQFLHASISHIFLNMLGLYLFGQIVESVIGPRRYLAFYLLCGVAGALNLMLLESIHLLPAGMSTGLVGASAGIYGLLVAAAIVAPDVQIILLIFPMRIRTAAVLAMVMAVYAVVAAEKDSNFGGEAAHLGGGILGFILIKNINWLNFLEPRRRSGMYIGPRRKRGFFGKDWSKDTDH